MSYVAFIPARSGSKRIPNKNIKILAGKPLLIWTLEACIASNKISTVILSTDSEKYISIAKNYIQNDKLKFDFREPSDASDSIKIFDYLVLKKDKIFRDIEEESFILALPTVPLRRTEHLEEAIVLFEKAKKPIFSATEFEFPISFAFTINQKENWVPLFEDSPMVTGNTRSQDNASAYRPNGAIYVRKILDLENKEFKTLYENAMPYLMEQNCSIDIDNETDFQKVEAMLASNRAL